MVHYMEDAMHRLAIQEADAQEPETTKLNSPERAYWAEFAGDAHVLLEIEVVRLRDDEYVVERILNNPSHWSPIPKTVRLSDSQFFLRKRDALDHLGELASERASSYMHRATEMQKLAEAIWRLAEYAKAEEPTP